MPGVNGIDFQTLQFFDTGLRCHQVVYNRIESGLSVLANRSPQNKLPPAVRIPIEPLECPGIEKTLASNPYSKRSDPSSTAQSGVHLSDLPNLKRIGAIILKRELPFRLFQNMSPRSVMPQSSWCMAILVPNFLRRYAALPV